MPGSVDEMDDVGMTFKDPLNGEAIETDSNDRRKELRTMMSTSFFTSVNMDSFGTAMRLRTWWVVPYTGWAVLTR